MKASTPTTFRVKFRTSAVNGTEAKLKIRFYHANNPNPADPNNNFTINTTQVASSATCASETGATALPGTLTAAGDNSAGVKTILADGLSDLSVSTDYCVDFTTSNAVTNPLNAGQYIINIETLTSANAVIDDKDVGTSVISDDQIVVSAVVPPIFNFALSGNTDAFTTNMTLTGVTSTSGLTATIVTNASKGWICWAKDSNQGLSSATAPYTIATSGSIDGTPSALSGGSEGYVLDVDMTTDATGGGAVTIDPEYNGTTTADGGTLSGTFQPVATASGTANGDVITFINRAAIAGSTPAGSDYTDTMTIVAAGNF
jgi:hypothetical protein